MKAIAIMLMLCLTVVSIFHACKKHGESLSQLNPAPAGSQNQPLIANAGPDQSIILPVDSAELKGGGSDLGGTIVSYEWTILGYDSLHVQYFMARYYSQNVTLKNLRQGTYRCDLVVRDNRGLTAKDQSIITVNSINCPCYPDPCDAIGDPCDPWDY